MSNLVERSANQLIFPERHGASQLIDILTAQMDGSVCQRGLDPRQAIGKAPLRQVDPAIGDGIGTSPGFIGFVRSDELNTEAGLGPLHVCKSDRRNPARSQASSTRTRIRRSSGPASAGSETGIARFGGQ